MPKFLSAVLLTALISACSSAPPEPPLDKGEWVPLPVAAKVAAPAPAAAIR